MKLLKILVEMLDDARNDLYLHIDKKVKNFNRNEFRTTHANLHFIEHRLDVRWGHYSQIELELRLFETAFRAGEGRGYSYFHLLSGTALPIKSQEYIYRFFHTHSGLEFVDFWNHTDEDALQRMSHYDFFMEFERIDKRGRYISIFFSKLRPLLRRFMYTVFGSRPVDMTFKKGPNWISITPDFCRYLLSKKEWIRKRFKHTACTDEVFVQTILWNSPFRDSLYRPAPQEDRKSAIHEIKWDALNNPYTWRLKDLEYLKKSEKLFARKMSSEDDFAIIKEVKKHVENSSLKREHHA